MEKVTIIGAKNLKNKLCFTIRKNKNMREFLGEFLTLCGFEDNVYTSDYDFSKTDVPSFKDKAENHSNERFDIDIIYGNNAIFLIIKINNDEQRKFVMKSIRKLCKFRS